MVKSVVLSLYFFFQAEDGIRDSSVTGVQTCALPILVNRSSVVVFFNSGTSICWNAPSASISFLTSGVLRSARPSSLTAVRSGADGYEIGRASCRERVWVWVDADA